MNVKSPKSSYSAECNIGPK